MRHEQVQPQRMRQGRVATLFWEFFKIGCCTFGGGWSIVAQIEKQYVQGQKLLTSQDLLDLTSVGRSLPGVMIANVSFLFGHQVGGVLCGFACVFGIALPPLIILTFVTLGYHVLQGNPMMLHAMTGVRAAVVPIILSSAVALRKGAFTYPVCFGIAAVAFALSLFWGVGCIPLILFGMAAGVAVCEWKKRKGEGPHGAA